MTKLHDMSLPHLLSLLSRLERMVKIMAIITIASTAFYILNYLVMSNNPELDPQRIETSEITTKSWFGSHSEMVIEELEDGKVVCEDDNGKYITYANRLDNGLADPRRSAKDRMMENG